MPELAQAALIIGASGGIGRALHGLWAEQGRYPRLLGTSRKGGRDLLPLDLEDEASLAALPARLAERLGDAQLVTVCICSGVLHDQSLMPERRLEELEADAFLRIMRINALGPLAVARAVVPLLPRDRRSRLLAVSARVGSIADNRLGGWYSYRCSKAALNQGFKTLAVELKRVRPECVLTLFHPGTVDTPLSGPFQRNVPEGKLFGAHRAATQLSDVLHGRDEPAAHLFVDWAGQDVAY